ncbi:hypothetical protein CDAR_409821 [Caerostris darwini]|uniref:Uncharacterized protein n=1 Tax=Caerostris darwini TaxID=1538125 RepID=A0AAV4RLJ0_9ARAC|nr:hypothetical protein CDAR_409821 [Caerostris darwini]
MFPGTTLRKLMGFSAARFRPFFRLQTEEEVTKMFEPGLHVGVEVQWCASTFETSHWKASLGDFPPSPSNETAQLIKYLMERIFNDSPGLGSLPSPLRRQSESDF